MRAARANEPKGLDLPRSTRRADRPGEECLISFARGVRHDLEKLSTLFLQFTQCFDLHLTVGISGGGAESGVPVETDKTQSQEPAQKRADSPPSTACRVSQRALTGLAGKRRKTLGSAARNLPGKRTLFGDLSTF